MGTRRHSVFPKNFSIELGGNFLELSNCLRNTVTGAAYDAREDQGWILVTLSCPTVLTLCCKRPFIHIKVELGYAFPLDLLTS